MQYAYTLMIEMTKVYNVISLCKYLLSPPLKKLFPPRYTVC